jgi:hypothetical protein
MTTCLFKVVYPVNIQQIATEQFSRARRAENLAICVHEPLTQMRTSALTG